MLYGESGVQVAGIGFTGALAPVRPPKRGDHRLTLVLLVAKQTSGFIVPGIISWSIVNEADVCPFNSVLSQIS